MKKIIIFPLVLFCAVLCSCGNNTAAVSASPTTSQSTVTPEQSAVTPEQTASGEISVDKNLLTVDLTLPASLFSNQDMSKFDPDEYTEENGFIKTVINNDGSLTVTMTKARHTELMDEMKSQMEKTFSEYVGSEDTPYITDITYADDFKTVTIKVDKEKREKAIIDIVPLAVGMNICMYQAFNGDDLHVEITTIDAATGNVIDSIIYPDAFNA